MCCLLDGNQEIVQIYKKTDQKSISLVRKLFVISKILQKDFTYRLSKYKYDYSEKIFRPIFFQVLDMQNEQFHEKYFRGMNYTQLEINKEIYGC